MSHVVALPVCDGMTMLEYGTVLEALSFEWNDLPSLGYDVRGCGPADGVRTLGGAVLRPAYGLDEIASADTVIITAVSDPRTDSNPEWHEPLRAAAANGARIVSICTGAFALAAAGLLDGRRATTHWRHAGLLQYRFPRVHVTPSELYIQDGPVLTGAGSAAGLDLCLHLIRSDHGAGTANEVARRLVVAPHRDGDQSQFVNIDTLRPDMDKRFADFLQGLAHGIGGVKGLDDMAARAGVSRRTLHRRFRQYTGVAPLEWLMRQRVYRAMRLLETTNDSVTAITGRAGFDAEETLRYHFKRQTGLAPTAYRERFRGSDVGRSSARTVAGSGGIPAPHTWAARRGPDSVSDMRIQQMRKVFGGTRAAPTTNRTPGWLREFASGVAAGNLVRHGAGVPGAHDSRICERPRLGPAPAGRHASER